VFFSTFFFLSNRPSQRFRGERRREKLPTEAPFTAYITGLNKNTPQKDFIAYLGPSMGEEIADVRWRDNGVFIDFKNVEALKGCLKLDRQRYKDRSMQVNIAKPMKKGGGGGGGRRDRPKFKEHLPLDEVKEMLEKGLLCQGAIRVNPHNRREAYATVNGFVFDVKFPSVGAQNRAYDGETVAIAINPKSDWIKMEDAPVENMLLAGVEEGEDDVCSISADELEEEDEEEETTTTTAASTDAEKEEELVAAMNALQIHQKHAAEEGLRPTGKVVAILNRKAELPHHVGWLQSSDDKDLDEKSKFAFLVPFSKKMHRILVPLDRLPSSWRKKEFYATHLYACQVQSWKISSSTPFGKLTKDYGEGGTLEVEKTILLEANNIDYDDSFSPAVNACLPEKDFRITDEEVAKRRDLRKLLVCSIDPATAKDLDDALSIEKLPNGNYQVGVHIADVTHFVQPNTAIDEEARNRATSVYLVDQCIPMLPRILSERLCSLNSGQDCLAFTALFELSSTGKVVSEWFGKTVIRNAMQMSYGTAQAIIDGEAKDEDFKIDPVTTHTIDDVKTAILALNKMGHVLRKNRFENGGSVNLESVKLQFKLDEETGMPLSCSQYEGKSSNELVEDFMLLANRQVGEFILKKYPDGALLRRHEKPGMKMKEFVEMCQKFGYKVDPSSSFTLNQTLDAINDPNKPGVRKVIYYLALRAMQLAKYTQTDPEFPTDTYYWHYALSYKVYTHFTSPIRRYADCIVHRVLHHAVTNQPQPESKADITLISENCNDRKVQADRASSRSDVVFLCHYLKDKEPQEYEGYVYRITAKAFDVMCPEYGIEDGIMLDRLGLVKESNFEEDKYSLTVTFDSYNSDYFVDQKIDEKNDNRPLTLTVQMFQKVKVFCKIKDAKRELDMGLKIIIDETGLKK
jgi:VacB/RNase II family 3'-5' exoribonuclease